MAVETRMFRQENFKPMTGLESVAIGRHPDSSTINAVAG